MRRWLRYILAALCLHLLIVGGLWFYLTRAFQPERVPVAIVVAELLPAAVVPPSLPQSEGVTEAPAEPLPQLQPEPVARAAGPEMPVADAVEFGDFALQPLSPALPGGSAAESVPAPQPETTPVAARAFESTVLLDARQQWESQVLQYLEQRKRYPAMAQFLGQEDEVSVRLRVGRDGSVLSHQIVSSRRYRRLDEEVVGLIGRASPLPPPPPELTDGDLEFRVSIAFSLERHVVQTW